MTVGQVIVSSNEDGKYLNFWPLVSRAWRELVGIEPLLVLVSDQPEPSLRTRLESFGLVTVVPSVPYLPTSNQAKLARFYIAAQMEKPSLIEDIDTCPLSAVYPKRIMELWDGQSFLAVGREVYEHQPWRGRFPVSNMAGTADAFKQFFSVGQLDFSSWLELLIEIGCDESETCPRSVGKFSDERLILKLTQTLYPSVAVQHIERRIDVNRDWIDRGQWFYSPRRLQRNEYLYANFPRPIHAFPDRTKGVVEHLFGSWSEAFFSSPMLPIGEAISPSRSRKRPWRLKFP